MKAEQHHLDAAYAAAMAARDTGKSPTADMRRYSDAAAIAALALVPETNQSKSPRPRRAR